MRRSTWTLVLLWGSACGPKAGAVDGGEDALDGGLVDGGGDVGTGDLPEPGQGSIPDDYDPRDCIDSLLVGQRDAAIFEERDGPDACLACAPVGTCTHDDQCAAGARCDFTLMLPGPGHCIRECSDDGACTGELRCLDMPARDGGRLQLCGTLTNDAWACEVYAEPEPPCAGLTDPESCQALGTTHPRGERCDWITETIFDSGAACDTIDTEGRCEVTVPADECRRSQGCGPDDVEYLWRDYGAGTVGLLAVPHGRRLDRKPAATPRFDYCDFSGDVPLPGVCSCGDR